MRSLSSEFDFGEFLGFLVALKHIEIQAATVYSGEAETELRPHHPLFSIISQPNHHYYLHPHLLHHDMWFSFFVEKNNGLADTNTSQVPQPTYGSGSGNLTTPTPSSFLILLLKGECREAERELRSHQPLFCKEGNPHMLLLMLSLLPRYIFWYFSFFLYIFCFLFGHDNVIVFIMMQPVYVNCSFAPLDGFAFISTKGPAA